MSMSTTRETSSVQFISPLKLMVMHGMFEVVDLESLDSQKMLHPADRRLEFVRQNTDKPIAVYRSLGAFLLCYDKFGFHVDARGMMARNGEVLRWTVSAVAFAQHGPHILAFSQDRAEIWHVEKAERVQIISGRHLPLNSRHFSVCRHLEPIPPPRTIALSDTVVDLVFRELDN
ncbi:CNH domain-containing protein [Mycena galericulata]|nr:CNH domain-containing protein [Mycena galericulata]